MNKHKTIGLSGWLSGKKKKKEKEKEILLPVQEIQV